MSQKVLRRVIRLGPSSQAITIPKAFLKAEFVWIEKTDGTIIIKPAEVR